MTQSVKMSVGNGDQDKSASVQDAPLERASINHGRNIDDPWINGSITGCAYRAELKLGR